MAVAVEFTSDNAKLLRGQAQLEKKVETLTQRLKAAGQTGRRAGDDIGRSFQKAERAGKGAFDPKLLVKFGAGLVGVGSVAAAIGTVNKKYETTLKNLREISAEARKAGDNVIAFAALQEGGTKAERVQRAAGVAAAAGVKDRGLAFTIVQGLQSALGGDFERGLAAAKTVFEASKVGIPLRAGSELEILGISQGEAPGVTIRRAFVAGQASARDPAVIAGAASAFKFFDDKVFANAVAGVISASVDPGELKTFVKAAGVGLSGVSTLAPKFKELGVGAGATRRERLQALFEAGITTPEQLKAAGLGELRQQEAISTLLTNLSEIDRIAAAVREKAVPGLFVRQRRGVEAELPDLVIQRKIDIAEAKFKNVTAFGPKATEAQRLELRQKNLGVAFRGAGIEEGTFGLDFIDEEGRVTEFARGRHFVQTLVREIFTLGFSDAAEEMRKMEEIARELGVTFTKLERIAQENAIAQERQKDAATGGPGLKPPGLDK